MKMDMAVPPWIVSLFGKAQVGQQPIVGFNVLGSDGTGRGQIAHGVVPLFSVQQPKPAPDLEKELRDVLDRLTELTLDLEKLEYISSAGLRVLLTAQKVMNRQGEMKITHVNSTIMEIFEVTGFTEILTIG